MYSGAVRRPEKKYAVFDVFLSVLSGFWEYRKVKTKIKSFDFPKFQNF